LTKRESFIPGVKADAQLAVLNNEHARQLEHKRHLEELGFPEEVEPDFARHAPVSYDDPCNPTPSRVVNQAGQDLGDPNKEDSDHFDTFEYKKVRSIVKEACDELFISKQPEGGPRTVGPSGFTSGAPRPTKSWKMPGLGKLGSTIGTGATFLFGVPLIKNAWSILGKVYKPLAIGSAAIGGIAWLYKWSQDNKAKGQTLDQLLSIPYDDKSSAQRSQTKELLDEALRTQGIPEGGYTYSDMNKYFNALYGMNDYIPTHNEIDDFTRKYNPKGQFQLEEEGWDQWLGTTWNDAQQSLREWYQGRSGVGVRPPREDWAYLLEQEGDQAVSLADDLRGQSVPIDIKAKDAFNKVKNYVTDKVDGVLNSSAGEAVAKKLDPASDFLKESADRALDSINKVKDNFKMFNLHVELKDKISKDPAYKDFDSMDIAREAYAQSIGAPTPEPTSPAAGLEGKPPPAAPTTTPPPPAETSTEAAADRIASDVAATTDQRISRLPASVSTQIDPSKRLPDVESLKRTTPEFRTADLKTPPPGIVYHPIGVTRGGFKVDPNASRKIQQAGLMRMAELQRQARPTKVGTSKPNPETTRQLKLKQEQIARANPSTQNMQKYNAWLQKAENEGAMAKVQLDRVSDLADMMHDALDESDELPGWIQNKISDSLHNLEASITHIAYDKKQDMELSKASNTFTNILQKDEGALAPVKAAYGLTDAVTGGQLGYPKPKSFAAFVGAVNEMSKNPNIPRSWSDLKAGAKSLFWSGKPSKNPLKLGPQALNKINQFLEPVYGKDTLNFKKPWQMAKPFTVGTRGSILRGAVKGGAAGVGASLAVEQLLPIYSDILFPELSDSSKETLQGLAAFKPQSTSKMLKLTGDIAQQVVPSPERMNQRKNKFMSVIESLKNVGGGNF